MAENKSKQYKELNLKQKVELINFLESNSERKAAEQFAISKTTVHNIKKRKLEYLSRYENDSGSSKRKLKTTQYESVNEAVFLWLKKMRGINARVSGDLIKEVALQYATKYETPDFKASNGWLQKFCSRHNLSYKTLSGESNEVSNEVVENFKEKFEEFSRGYVPGDVFNADECGLFFKAMPNKSYVFIGEKCKSGKMSKERLTVLLCTSVTGEKLKPLVIGKSKSPRAFKNLKTEDIPVIWRFNSKAWMTGTIFEEWLNIINRQMKRQKRKILLTLDNCPAHPRIENLSNVTLKFLPANTTSVIQPLDQGIIKNFKHFYRSFLLKSIVAGTIVENVTEYTKKINVLDAVQWINLAWNNVKPETIFNCFKKAGFIFNDQQNDDVDYSDEEVTIIDTHDLPPFNSEVFLSIDDGLCVCEEPDPNQIFQSVLDELNNSTVSTSIIYSSESEADDEQARDFENLPSQVDVAAMLQSLKKFSKEKCPAMFNSVSKAETIFEDFVARKPKIQKPIDDYFSKSS